MNSQISSVGTVEMVNAQNPPLLVNLSTRSASVFDSKLSDVTWSMTEQIKVPSPNHAAIITLKSFTFFNSFYNIVNGKNTLKVLSTWTNNGSKEEYLLTLVVPPGTYTITSLLDYINSNINSLSGGILYGLGNPADVPNSIAETLAFTQTADSTRLILNCAEIAYLNSNPAAYDVTHSYTGFYLLVDDATKGFMRQLGLIDYNYSGNANNQRIISNSVSGSLVGIGFDLNWTGATYAYFNPQVGSIISPDALDISGINQLGIHLQSGSSNSRNSYQNLSIGDCIASVPVTGSAGYKTTYEPPNLFRAIVTNFQTNNFNIIVRDTGTGAPVDFHGVHWDISLVIEMKEIENASKGGASKAGEGEMHIPVIHNAISQYKNMLPIQHQVTGHEGSLFVKQKKRKEKDRQGY